MPYARSRRTGLVRSASRTPTAVVGAFHHAHPRSVPLITTPTGTSMSDLISTAFAPEGFHRSSQSNLNNAKRSLRS